MKDFDEVTRREARAEARKEVRAEVLNDMRTNTAQLVRERFGDRAAARAQARLADVTQVKTLMDAHGCVVGIDTESAMLDRLARI